MTAPLRMQSMILCVALIGIGCAKGTSSLDNDATQAAERTERAEKQDMLCGNEKIDPLEECDGVLLDGATCVSLNYVGGQLACDPVTCSYDVSMCMRPSQGSTGGAGPD